MMELINSIEWDDYKDILLAGNPPIYMQLLIFNAVIVAYFLYRKMSKTRAMTKSRARLAKFGILGFNSLILFQEKFDVRGMMDNITF